MSEGLRVVPSTQWVSVRGNHPGALVEVRRVTPTAVYYRTIREGAGTGPRHRKGGPKNRLDHAEFLLNYRPNTKRDWMRATQNGTEEGTKDPVTTAVDQVLADKEALAASGRLHAEEEAIAQAIRDGTPFHDVQRDYRVHGRVLMQIIEKYGVPYESVRQKENAARAKREQAEIEAVLEVPAEASVEAAPQPLLHPQEPEIVEMMRARAGSFQDILRDYHVKSTVLVAIMERHGIPKQTDEEKRAKARAYYHQRRAREAQEAQEREAAQPAVEETPVAASAPVEAPAPVVAAPPAAPAPGLHTWHIEVRTTLHATVQAASYLEAAQSVLHDCPTDAEIVRIERVS